MIEDNRFANDVIFSYVCTTLDGNYISRLYDYYIVWQISEIRKKNNQLVLDMVYFTSEDPEIKKIEDFYIDEFIRNKLLAIKEDYKKTLNDKKEADGIVQSNFPNVLNYYYDRQDFLNSLKEYSSTLKRKIDFQTMSNRELARYIFSSDFLLFQEWGRKNSDYVKQQYIYNELEEFTYRDFKDITDYELKQLLIKMGECNYRTSVKIDRRKYPYYLKWSPYVKSAYIADPFKGNIIVEKKYESTDIERDWVPEKHVWDFDGMDNASYTIPGHWNETITELTDIRKNNITKKQLYDVQEYCLTRQIGPEWMRVNKL